MRIRTSILIAWIAASNAFAAVTVSNLTVAQREGTKLVDIYFDADNDDGTDLSVSVTVSNNSANIHATSFSGAFGNSVSEGTGLHVVWDGGADFPDEVSVSLIFIVQVSEPIPSSMVRIPGGTNSGTDPDGLGSYSLTVESFLMNAAEVSEALWDTHASAGISGDGKYSDHPVLLVTWEEAARWCNDRSSAEGLAACYTVGSWACNFSANGYRLPTEEEWEYAARGGLSGNRYPWGDEIDHTNANFYSTYEDEHHPGYVGGGMPYTAPSVSFEPNGYGLHNMAGNVWEWCNDFKEDGRVLRGGGWNSWEVYLRCGDRRWAQASTSNTETGFRTVRNSPLQDQLGQAIAFDSRDYELTVSSDYGVPVPMVGTSVFSWKATVPCSVESEVLVNGTNFTCIGWSGTGGVPMSGSLNEVIVVLSELNSSITWTWASEDTDLDGMNDDWELLHFSNLDQAFTNDFDFDGQDNGSEYIAGTNPTNPASLFRLSERLDGDLVIIQWPAASNRIYNLYSAEGLQYYGFQPLETNMAFPRNSATTTATNVRGFYKVDVRNP